MSTVSHGVLGCLVGGTHVPFLRVTHRYNVSNTTVRRHVHGLSSSNIVLNDQLVISPGVVNFSIYTRVDVALGSPRLLGRAIRRLGRVPRVIRTRFVANSNGVLIGLCYISGRRLVHAVFSNVLHVRNISSARARVSLRRTFRQRIGVSFVRR